MSDLRVIIILYKPVFKSANKRLIIEISNLILLIDHNIYLIVIPLCNLAIKI